MDNYSSPNFPQPVQIQGAMMVKDGAGTRYVAATTNGSPEGGVYVWRIDGDSMVEVLSPGTNDAAMMGTIQIYPDGYGYLVAPALDKTHMNEWQIPGWVPVTHTNHELTGS